MQGQIRSYVLTTLVTAPSSGNLTTLANARDDLDIDDPNDTSNDARLTRYITEESSVIASYCNRVFGLATWQDEFRPQRGVWGEGVGGAVNPLKLTRWPLAVNVIAFTGNTHSSALVDGLSSTSGLVTGQLVSGPGIAAGTTITSVNTGAFSLQLSAPALATASVVSLSTGISVVESIAGTDTGLTAGVDFEIATGTGLPGDEGISALYRLNNQGNPKTWPAAKIVVVYQAGYLLPQQSGSNLNGAQTVPPDLEGVCLRIVADRFRSKARDPMLVERNQGAALGSERYWVGSMPGQSGPYPNEIMSKLDSYRTPVTA
jgi:hypothetical protein